MALLQSTLDRLQDAYDEGHREVIVSYSAGKDSVATFDLCSRVFDKVHAFFLYIHPDLRIEQDKIEQAQTRFGIRIHQFPNISAIDMLRAGYYMHHPVGSIPRKVTYRDIQNVVRDRFGCKLIASGYRMDESLQRRGMIKAAQGWDKKLGKLYPLWNWNAKAVYSYLRFRKLSPLVIKTFGGDTSGISLGTNSLLYLKKHHPGDFKKLTGMFPLANTKLLREELRLKAGMGPSETSKG